MGPLECERSLRWELTKCDYVECWDKCSQSFYVYETSSGIFIWFALSSWMAVFHSLSFLEDCLKQNATSPSDPMPIPSATLRLTLRYWSQQGCNTGKLVIQRKRTDTLVFNHIWFKLAGFMEAWKRIWELWMTWLDCCLLCSWLCCSFQRLPQGLPTDDMFYIGRQQMNAIKNRYQDILPCEWPNWLV